MVASTHDGNRNSTDESTGFSRTHPHSRADDSHQVDSHQDDPQPFDALIHDFAEIREYAAHYLAARKDAVAASIRALLAKVILGAIAGAVGLTAIVTAAVLLLIGAAEGLGALFGGYVWAGYLFVGVLVIGSSLVAVKYFLGSWSRSSRRKTMEKYEHRHDVQRAAFGRDAVERAAGAVPRGERFRA
jgi:hypothetical protein